MQQRIHTAAEDSRFTSPGAEQKMERKEGRGDGDGERDSS